MAIATQRFLDPKVLAGISGLDLVAKTVVDGFISGLHQSPDFGFSQEFAEYRLYEPGDDLRHVDWNVFARSERMYLKRYRGETNTLISIVLDASKSMHYGSRGMEKLEYARFLTASLAYLAHLQRDASGLIVFDGDVRAFIPPAAKQGQLMRILHTIDQAEAGTTETNFTKPLSTLTDYLAKRSIVAVVSDFWEDPEAVMKAIGPLRARGNEIILFQVLDPDELEPKFKGPMLLEDLESGESMQVSPDYAKREYKAKMDAHLEDLKKKATARGIHYFLCDTSKPLDGALRQYLAMRAGKF